MNSTQRATLTEFVKYLGRTGKCKVEETEKGWFMTYIDREEKMKHKRARADLVDEAKQEKEIRRQIGRAEQSMPEGRERSSERDGGEASGLLRTENGGKVVFALGGGGGGPKGEGLKGEGSKVRKLFDDGEGGRNENKGARKFSDGKSALDDLMREEERVKEASNRKDYWLCEGIIVKAMSKALPDKGNYKKKGFVRKVIDRYVGEIKMIDTKHVLRVDQEELETVIPQIGGLVRIVNGACRGSNARLLAVDTDKYCAKVEIEKGLYDGRELPAVEYEDICKIGL